MSIKEMAFNGVFRRHFHKKLVHLKAPWYHFPLMAMLAAGAPYFNLTDAVHIYGYSNNAWSYQTTLTQQKHGSLEGSVLSLAPSALLWQLAYPIVVMDTGCTNLYSKTKNSWLYNITLSQLTNNAIEGFSVSLSDDGQTLAVGAPGYKECGQAFIYGN